MDITTATPAEIDTLLAEIHERAEVPFARYTVSKMEAAKIARSLANDPRTYYDADDLAKSHRRAAEYRAQYDAIMVEAQPLDAEFERRGGWTRAFLVLNTGGHLHRSMACDTCFPTTRFGWLPQESGKDEAEIVEGAGSDACTRCYPSAPVVSLSQPRRTLHKTEVEAQQARDEKAAKRAAKEAKEIADALIDPATGRPIKDTHGWAAKEKAATSDYVDSAAYLHACANGYSARGRVEECAAFVARFVTAMAAKHGKTEAEVVADLAKKVAARIKRDYS